MMTYYSPKIKQYRRYRKAGKDLHHKVIGRYVKDDVLEEAARALGLGKNRQLDLDNEEELSVLMEYAIYEIKRDSEWNFIEQYQDEVGGKNRVERELLAAKARAETGLFRVKGVWPERHNIELVSITGEMENITLTDIGFSQSMLTDVIMFFRPIRLPEFTTTSGISFVYPGELQEELQEIWQEWKLNSSAERYVKAFQLYKSKGFPTLYV